MQGNKVIAKQLFRKKISLKEKPHKTKAVESSHYPSLYLYDLPLKDANVDEKFSAEVSLKLTSIAKRTGQRTSFEFEVIDIKFK